MNFASKKHLLIAHRQSTRSHSLRSDVAGDTILLTGGVRVSDDRINRCVANADLVVFAPRWLVGQDTFRPPWYHLNAMSEFMGLLYGVYDARPKGFLPGGASLHNCMIPHGPSPESFEAASEHDLSPQHIDGGISFMFESRYPYRITDHAMNGGALQKDYPADWQRLKRQFTG